MKIMEEGTGSEEYVTQQENHSEIDSCSPYTKLMDDVACEEA